eukprot:TRINITY_DN81515_c0_g1_i1.p1 TRINITY_DN81515_c0_g1~~TRINITY_DN81515_c0_g1_i1.p1  ORF type:complete len:478 (-),score=133.93 TRINITY_DN81515_c0_g1_i1:43-1476(-)
MAGEASAPTTDACGSCGYADLWETMHSSKVSKEGELVARHEWHVPYGDLLPLLRPYLDDLLSSRGGDAVERRPPPVVLDVGCGTSSLGSELLADLPSETSLLLVDVVPQLVEALKEKHKDEPRISAAVGDCRDLSCVAEGGAAIVLDKGTVDAMSTTEDRQACLAAMARCVEKPRGLIVSVSFFTSGRVLLLQREAKRLGLQLRLRLLKAGPELRLVALLSQSFGGLEDAMDAWTEDQISVMLYKRPLSDERFVHFEHEGLGADVIELEQMRVNERDSNTTDDATGLLVWPAARAFSAHLCKHPEIVRDKRVVELGAGTGLAGLVAAALGAKEVVMTDLTATLPLLRRNVERNAAAAIRTPMSALELRWGASSGPGAELADFDVVLACEIVYQHDAETYEALVASIKKLLRPGGVVLVTYEFRSGLVEDLQFFDRMDLDFESVTESLNPYGYGIPKDADEDGDSWRMLYSYRAKPAS